MDVDPDAWEGYAQTHQDRMGRLRAWQAEYAGMPLPETEINLHVEMWEQEQEQWWRAGCK